MKSRNNLSYLKGGRGSKIKLNNKIVDTEWSEIWNFIVHLLFYGPEISSSLNIALGLGSNLLKKKINVTSNSWF